MRIAAASEAGRFARLEAIEWWDQALLQRSRVLVIGAGALGNEVIKNLAMLGLGHLAIVDLDRVELSNLTRSVLFRESDAGQPKAECAARTAREIFPGVHAVAIVGNVLADVGLGWVRWAHVVIGALDNREARLFVNSACARVGRPWFDGGIEVLHGIARGFAPPATACYECTMSRIDWELVNQRRSCSLLARRAQANRGTPTTATTASIVAAIQVQEVIKHLHGRPALLGRGFVYDGAGHGSFAVNYSIAPDCPWHEAPAPIVAGEDWHGGTALREVWREAEARLGGMDAIDLAREMVGALTCPACGQREEIFRPVETVAAEQVRCPRCQAERTPSFLHSLTAGSPELDRSPRELGLPEADIVWARRGTAVLGFEIAGVRGTPLR